jgi:hypothetical protein
MKFKEFLGELVFALQPVTSGPDREMDCKIWACVHGWVPAWDKGVMLIDGVAVGNIDPGVTSRNFSCWSSIIPYYTSDVNHAQTLINPEWHISSIQQDRWDKSKFYCCLRRPYGIYADAKCTGLAAAITSSAVAGKFIDTYGAGGTRWQK